MMRLPSRNFVAIPWAPGAYKGLGEGVGKGGLA